MSDLIISIGPSIIFKIIGKKIEKKQEVHTEKDYNTKNIWIKLVKLLKDTKLSWKIIILDINTTNITAWNEKIRHKIIHYE